jgi:thiamine-phosphate pyrophosphorylase
MAEMGAVTLRSFVMLSTLSEHADRLNFRNHSGKHLPPLVLVTDEQRMPNPLMAMAQLRAGDAVLLRHYGAPHRRDLAFALAARCRAAGVRLVVGGDLDLARAVGAYGVHFPEGLASHTLAAKAAGFLVTVAAHDGPALAAALRIGADAALLSPVFATASHPGALALGVIRFSALVRESQIPVYALGGISASTAGRLCDSGAVGIAGVGAFSV